MNAYRVEGGWVALVCALVACGTGEVLTPTDEGGPQDVGVGSTFTLADVEIMTCPDVVVDSPSDEAPIVVGDANCTVTRPVTFSQDVLPITRRCSGEICHLWTPSTMVGVRADQCCDGRPIVKAGDPAGSYLIDKLSGSNICRGARMPYGGTPLSPAQMETVVDWICAGALDN